MRKSKLFVFLSVLVGIVVILIVYFSLAVTGVIRTSIRDITIKSLSASKDYDGTALVCEEYSEVENLYEGDRVEIVFTGTQTDAGESNNTFIATIYDSFDNNVTSNYNITPVYGTLTVNKRRIVVNANNIKKDYDGSSLSIDKTYEITGSSFSKDNIVSISGSSVLEGDTLYLTEKGETDEAGVKQDINFSFIVKKSNGDDVSKNYDVSINNDSEDKPYLEINQIDLKIQTTSKTKEYDGKALKFEDDSTEGYTIANGSLESGDTLSVKYLNSITNVGTVKNEVVVNIFDSESNDVTEKYNITYNLGSLEVTQHNITYSYYKTVDYTGIEEKLDFADVSFSGINVDNFKIDGYVSFSETDDVTLPGNHTVNVTITSFEAKVTDEDGNVSYEDALNNYKFVPNIIKVGNESVTYCILVINPKEVAIKINSIDSITYDGLSHESLVIKTLNSATPSLAQNLLDGDTATIIFYENGSNTPDYTSAGTHIYEPNIIVLDADGNDRTNLYNFTLSLNDGKELDGIYLTIEKYTLTLSSKSATKEGYDGEAFSCEEFNSGILPKAFEKLNIYTSKDDVKSSDSEYLLIDAKFVSLTKSGSIDNKFIIYDIIHCYSDSIESESIINNFNINCYYGTLTITEELEEIILYPVLIAYYGTEITNTDLAKTDVILAIQGDNGEYVIDNTTTIAYTEFVSIESAKEVGTYDIQITTVTDLYIYKKDDDKKTDISNKLNITYETGTLSIIYDRVTIIDSYSSTIEYDGDYHSYYSGDKKTYILNYITYKQVNTNLDLSDFTFEYTLDEEIYDSSTGSFNAFINAGIYRNDFTVTIYDSDGNDVTSYFKIVRKRGQLTIDPITVATLTSVSATYDETGNTHEQIVYEGVTYGGSSNYSISDLESILSQLCGGNTVTITFDNSISGRNYFYVTVKNSSGDELESFLFNCDYGVLS